jgi:hypothetical protein
MNYRIKRGEQEFGPYTLAELQHYVQTLYISPEDLALSEGMTEWIPVSQVLGDIPIPPAAQPGGFGVTELDVELAPQTVPLPPNVPWPVFLVIYISFYKPLALLGVLANCWGFVQANWARKLSGKNTPLVLMFMYPAGWISGIAVALFAGLANTPGLAVIGALLIFAGAICRVIANFSIRDAMEEYYNTVEVIGLGLSGVMVFFFGVIYIQYHINRITRWKQTGVLS